MHLSIKKLKYFYRFVPGVTTALLMFSLGGFLTLAKPPLHRADYFMNYYSSADALVLRLNEAPIEKEKSYKTVVEVIGIIHEGKTITTSGKILFYVARDSSSQSLEVDDVIITTSAIGELNEVQNPFEFNYKKYLNSHFIYNQMYADEKGWTLVNRPENHSFMGIFINWREQMLKQFKRYQVSGQEYAVLAALVLGKTDAIDFHLMSSYASAGAIHVLAVSGLHVGLIYVLLAPALRLIFPGKKRKFLKFIIPTLILWLYAGVTGFSPSVLRAAVMFTAFVIAETYDRKSNIFNTMSASAVVLLCFNPYIIMEVGFQLSYLAVIGIVILQKRISDLWPVRNKWLRKVWQLTAVSFAAQLITFPLGMLYFHQFPNYFLVSNLIVIPLSTLILYISLLFFALCWWPPVAQFLATVSAWLTHGMNAIVLWFDQLPYSIVQGISLTVLESYILFAMIWCLCRWFFWKKPKALVYAFVFTAALCISQVVEKTSIVQFSEICVHNIPGHNCITYCKGEKGYIIYDGGLMDNESRIRFHLKNYWNHLGIKEFQHVELDSAQTFEDENVLFHYPFITAGNKTFAIATEEIFTKNTTVHADYFLFEKSSSKLFFDDQDLDKLNKKHLIITNDFSKKKLSFLKNKLEGKAELTALEVGAVIIRGNELKHHTELY